MLEPIGEATVRTTTRTDNHLTVGHRDIDLRKVAKAVEERPIESSQESTKPESDADQKAGAYKTDDEGVFFEKYDKDGNVVYRTPPEKKPLDERA